MSFPDETQSQMIQLVSRAERAEARVSDLEAALTEAMEWNWLDDDAEETIPKWIAETLKPKPAA